MMPPLVTSCSARAWRQLGDGYEPTGLLRVLRKGGGTIKHHALPQLVALRTFGDATVRGIALGTDLDVRVPGRLQVADPLRIVLRAARRSGDDVVAFMLEVGDRGR